MFYTSVVNSTITCPAAIPAKSITPTIHLWNISIGSPTRWHATNSNYPVNIVDRHEAFVWSHKKVFQVRKIKHNTYY